MAGIATLFNTQDLSNYNFDLNNLGFKNDTEKSIFYLSMVNTLVNGRYRVLQMMKNNERILEFSKKLPLFNGKPYYYFTDLNIPDFKWNGYDKLESYNERYIGSLLNTLLIQLSASSALNKSKDAKDLYFNSVLAKPEYFKYSSAAKDILTQLFEKQKGN